MIAKRTSDRYQSMAEVIADLERCRSGQSVTVNVNAVSGDSASGNELQNFLRQISGGSGSEFSSATTSPPGTGARPVDPVAETVLLAANGSGTDPQTEQTLTHDRSRGQHDAPASGFAAFATRSRVVLMAVAGVCLLLLGGWWLFRTPRGELLVEITDKQIEVTFGETGRSLRGEKNETIKLPIGEHVLHVKLGDVTLDTPEITVAKGEPVAIKVEKVGNRVRVERNKEFLVAKELPRSKSGGSKAGSSATTTAVVPQFALEFDGQASYVELPNVGLNSVKPFTVEAWVRLSKPIGPAADGIILAGSGVMLSRSAKGLWLFHVNGMRGQIVSDTEAVVDEWVHVAAVGDGQSRTMYVNGQPQKKKGGLATIQTPREVTTEVVLSGSPRRGKVAGEKFLPGQMREVRVSSVARYQADFKPAQRFAPDKDTLGLYHFDEGSGDELKDSSANKQHGKIVGAKWVRAEGTATVETLAKGNDSVPNFALEFALAGKSVEIPLANLDPNQPWTLEGYVQPADIPGHNHGLLAIFWGDAWRINLNHWSLRLLEMSVPTGQPGIENVIAATSLDPFRGKLVHVAATYDGKLARLFVDGKLIGSSPAKFLPKQNQGKLLLGARFQGTMDEWRISKVGRYEKDFSPPNRYEPDANTLALYHFDEGAGDVLKDSSGNNHHGKIVGANWVKANGGSVTSGDSDRRAVDLLALVDPTKDAIKGGWSRKGNDLVAIGPPGLHAVLEFPYSPAEEYDFVVEFTRTKGTNDVSLQFSKAGRGCGWCMSQEKVNFGFSRVDGQSLFQSRPELALVNGTRYVAKVEVRRDGVRGYLDGVKVSELKTDGSNLSAFHMTKLRNDKLLGLSLCGVEAVFHRVSVIEVTGSGKPSRPLAVTGTVPASAPSSIDLLAKIDVARDAVDKSWKIEKGALHTVSVSGDQKRRLYLPIPNDNRPDEYDLRLKAQRVTRQVSNDGNALVLGLVSGGRRTALLIDGYQRLGGLWGLEQVDGKVPMDNGTAVPNQPLKVDVPVEVLVQVRKTGIRVERDGQPLIDWKGSADNLSLHSYWDDQGPPRFFVGAQADFVIQRLTFEPANLKTNWLDVLPLIDPQRDRLEYPNLTGKNDWQMRDGELLYTGDAKSGKLAFPVRITGPNVEVEFDVTRTSGTAHLNVDLPSTKGPIPIELSRGGSVVQIGWPPVVIGKFPSKLGQRITYLIKIAKVDQQDVIDVFADGVSIGHWQGQRDSIGKPDPVDYPQATSSGFWMHPNTNWTIHRVRLRAPGGSVEPTHRSPVTSAGSPWTDWLGPKLKQGAFQGGGWSREGDAVTTDRTIVGTEVFPSKTRDGAVRVTYLLRGSKGVQLSAREHTTGGKRDFSYFAEETGEFIQIAQTGMGSSVKYLAKQTLPAGLSKDAPRTLEFRAVGETLTLTLNDSVTVTVKDAAQSDGLFAIAALKGVLIQKVEIQSLDDSAVNLLSKIDSATMAANSKASITNGTLQISGGRLPLPVENLPDEYDVRLRIERKSAGNALALGLVSGGRPVALVMDGFQSRGGLWGLENIDGKAPPDNGTAVPNQPLKVNEPAELLVQVRKTGIRVERDGKPLLDWKGTPNKLSLGGTWDDKGPARLFLGAQASFVIHRLELVVRVRPPVPSAGGPKP